VSIISYTYHVSVKEYGHITSKHTSTKVFDVSLLLLIMSGNNQLQHAIDTFHTTPTTHVNRGLMLLKVISWRHCLCVKWVPYIPGTTTQTPALNQALSQDSQVTYNMTCNMCNMYNKSGNMYNMYNRNKNMTGRQSPHGNPAVEPSFGCATYILGPSKIESYILHQLFQSRCKLFNIMSFRFSRLTNVHVTLITGITQ